MPCLVCLATAERLKLLGMVEIMSLNGNSYVNKLEVKRASLADMSQTIFIYMAVMVVVVQWNTCKPSTPTIRVVNLLKSTYNFLKNKQKIKTEFDPNFKKLLQQILNILTSFIFFGKKLFIEKNHRILLGLFASQIILSNLAFIMSSSSSSSFVDVRCCC